MGARKQRPFAYFPNLATFQQKKVSCNAADTEYIDWQTGTAAYGTPDIFFDTICYIEEEHLQFTHGEFYGDTTMKWQEL